MGFLTPNFPEGSDMVVRTLVVNSQPIDIQALLDGAITLLFEAQNFQKNGDMTTEETAQYFRDMVYEIMEFCEMVIECFNDSSFVDAVVDSLAGNGYTLAGSTGETGSATGSTVMGDILGDLEVPCIDGQELYGLCMQVVSTLHTYFTDFLELAEVYSNQYELAGKITDAIPVLGNFFDATIDMADWLAETFSENYAAAYTTAVQEEIACAIYELVLANCELTLNSIIEAYESVTGSGLDVPSTDIVSMIEYIINIPTAIAIQLVGRSHLMVLGLMNFAQDFLGLTVKNMRFFIGAYSDYPVPDDCGSWCYEFNLLDTLPAEITVLYGTWVGGGNTGVRQVYGNGYRVDTEGTAIGSRAGIEVTFPESAIVTNVITEMLLDGRGADETPASVGYRVKYNAENYFVEFPESTSIQNTETEINTEIFGTFQYLIGYGYKSSGAYDPVPNVRIRKIRFEGTGQNPFGLSNC